MLMTTYTLVERFFSRIWRRNKKYSERELRQLAAKRDMTLVKRGNVITLSNPVSTIHFAGKSGAEQAGA